MNRFVSIFMVISFALLILACTSSDEKTEQDSFKFRKTRWGMTMDEVKSSEDISPSKEKDGFILYNEQFEGIPSTMGYIFVDGKLIKAAYLFNERYQNPDDYIVTYERIKGLLIKSGWIVKNTLIELLLEGANNRCTQGVIFQSKKHYALEQKKLKSLQSDVKVE